MTTTVTITGTGVPHLSPGRAGPGVLVECGDVRLQFDAGRATALRLIEAGCARTNSPRCSLPTTTPTTFVVVAIWARSSSPMT